MEKEEQLTERSNLLRNPSINYGDSSEDLESGNSSSSGVLPTLSDSPLSGSSIDHIPVIDVNYRLGQRNKYYKQIKELDTTIKSQQTQLDMMKAQLETLRMQSALQVQELGRIGGYTACLGAGDFCKMATTTVCFFALWMILIFHDLGGSIRL